MGRQPSSQKPRWQRDADCSIKKKYGIMKKRYQLVVVQNGRCGVAHINNEKEVLEGPFETREEAAAAAERRYAMEACLQDPGIKADRLEGTPEDFTVTVCKSEHADFTDHYFIEEV